MFSLSCSVFNILISNVLPILVFFPVVIGALIFCTPFQLLSKCRAIRFWARSVCFIFSLLLWALFDQRSASFQFTYSIFWFSRINIEFSLGVDGISLFFIVLTAFLIPLCILSSWNSIINPPQVYYGLFLVLEGFIIAVFCVTDIFAFYIFFESVLVPIFLLIGVYGRRSRRVKAAYFFFLYTLLGSLFILLAVLVLFFSVGTTDFLVLQDRVGLFRFERECLLWIAFFCSFAVKVPIVPVHLWLPEAHVEAPTAGSVLLAGVLLKLGSYGIVRFSIGLFPAASLYFIPRLFTLAVVGVIYTSITALRQSDIKRVIAYASVAHMNITLVGLFSGTVVGLEGSIFQILSHGLVSGALFLCVGVIYDRYHTRVIFYYRGLAQVIPIFIGFFLFFIIANIALPGTSSFVGEFLILVGVGQVNFLVAIISAISIVLGGGYSLWLFNRLAFGNITGFLGFFADLNRIEFVVLFLLCAVVFFLGLFPNFILEPIHITCASLGVHLQSVLLKFFILIYYATT
jgi:proton-translocating NADH-quinone oxidoreductase chain M